MRASTGGSVPRPTRAAPPLPTLAARCGDARRGGLVPRARPARQICERAGRLPLRDAAPAGDARPAPGGRASLPARAATARTPRACRGARADGRARRAGRAAARSSTRRAVRSRCSSARRRSCITAGTTEAVLTRVSLLGGRDPREQHRRSRARARAARACEGLIVDGVPFPVARTRSSRSARAATSSRCSRRSPPTRTARASASSGCACTSARASPGSPPGSELWVGIAAAAREAPARAVQATDEIPPRLIPIYEHAGARYGVPWVLLASINKFETDFGANLSVSSAGAVGWMQFLPSTWRRYARRRDRRRQGRPVQPARRDQLRGPLPRRSGVRKNLARGGLVVQPLAAVRPHRDRAGRGSTRGLRSATRAGRSTPRSRGRVTQRSRGQFPRAPATLGGRWLPRTSSPTTPTTIAATTTRRWSTRCSGRSGSSPISTRPASKRCGACFVGSRPPARVRAAPGDHDRQARGAQDAQEPEAGVRARRDRQRRAVRARLPRHRARQPLGSAAFPHGVFRIVR